MEKHNSAEDTARAKRPKSIRQFCTLDLLCMFLYIFHDGLSSFFLSVAYLHTDLGTAVLDHITPMMRFELLCDEFANSDSDQSKASVCFDIQLAIGVSQEISQSVLARARTLL